ncbi:MAG TPA: hypothetical protein VF698_16325, partial [Thermoanaerobaculia bacterium]
MSRFAAFALTLIVCAATSAQVPYVVKDINGLASPGHSRPLFLDTVNGVALFRASDAEHGIEVWRTDGTAAGTTLAHDLLSGAASGSSITRWSLGVVNGRMIHYAQDAQGRGLFASDAATSEKIYGDPIVAPQRPAIFFRGFMYFVEDASPSADAFPLNLWRTDATPHGTGRAPFVPSGFELASYPIVLGDFMYVSLLHPETLEGGTYRTDGTTAGTTRIHDWILGSQARVVGSHIVFPHLDRLEQTTATYSLRATNGSGEPVKIGGDYSARPEVLLVDGERLYLAVDDGVSGRELWVTDGTAAGTRLLTDFYAGAASSEPAVLAAVGSRLYFVARDASGDWLCYAEAAGSGTTTTTTTTKVRTITRSGGVGGFALNGKLVFMWAAPGLGREWWTSDGTAEGTKLLFDVHAGAGNGIDEYTFAILGDRFVFSGSSAETGVEPWVSDGTTEGTRLLRNIR